MDQSVDSAKIAEELEKCGEIALNLDGHHSLSITTLIQLAISHPNFKQTDSIFQAGLHVARSLQEEITKRSPFIGEMVEGGWEEEYLIPLHPPVGTTTAAHFSELISPRQYQLALLIKAFDVLVTHTSEIESSLGRKVRAEALASAAAILNTNLAEMVRETVKEFDESITENPAFFTQME